MFVLVARQIQAGSAIRIADGFVEVNFVETRSMAAANAQQLRLVGGSVQDQGAVVLREKARKRTMFATTRNDHG